MSLVSSLWAAFIDYGVSRASLVSLSELLSLLGASPRPVTSLQLLSATMFSSLTTKIALKKVGLPSDILNFSGPNTSSTSPNKLRKRQPESIDQDEGNGGWSNWMSVKALPLTAQAWLSPPPPPIAIARIPGIGDKAPVDKNRKVVFGGGKRILLVFLRCVGCACK